MSKPLSELLFKMADDALIIGHRNSEWTGIGPMLEEDLAFSSMAQDKIGHAQALYHILHQALGTADADTLAFKRDEKEFTCCRLVELPIGEYDFSIMRQFLFDHAEFLRYEMLCTSSFLPLAQLAKKVKGEVKYHVLHADVFVTQLSRGNEESKARMQQALNFAWPFALGIFEEGEHEAELIAQQIFAGEKALKTLWLQKVKAVLDGAGLHIPDTPENKIEYGGRKGWHTEHLKPLLNEMTEVVQSDVTTAEW